MAYGDFAEFYDLLTENIDYRALAEYYGKSLSRLGINGGRLLDLACGSGSLSVQLLEAGFNVVGADISEEMLTVAASKSDKVQWLRLDMTDMPFEEEFDAVICGLDSINHLEDIEAVQAAFNCVYRALKNGGVFSADLNTPYKHLNILADNAFVFDYEGLFCSWQNELCVDDPLHRVDMYLDFFKARSDGLYKRYTDSLSEIAPEPDKIREMLIKSGFVRVETSEFLTDSPLNSDSEKYLINALK